MWVFLEAPINGAMDLAKSFLYTERWDLESHQNFLNVKNGILNLESRILSPHNNKLYMNQLANVDYDAKAKCPLFDKFMKEISCDDTEIENIILEILGCCLLSGNNEQLFFMFIGQGANGKGVLVDTVKAILGDYAVTVQPATIMESKYGSGATARPDLARLRGARAAFMSEGKKGDKLDEALVKQLTGGDVLAARPLYSDVIEFKPEFKIILSSNYLPLIRGTDRGIWRRIFPVPFDLNLDSEQFDTKLHQKLLEEKSGILNRLLDGLSRVQSQGFTKSDKVENLIQQYRQDSNNLEDFFCSSIHLSSDLETPYQDMYNHYTLWCDTKGEKYKSSFKEFNSFLSNKGVLNKRTKRSLVWTGIGTK